MTSEEHDLGYDPNYWHSDHYNASRNAFTGPIWDVLTDHPSGITVPQIRNELINDRRMREVQSWLLSFGAEHRHRAAGAAPGPSGKAPSVTMQERYRRLDPASPDPGHWTWTVEQRYRYALTERIHYNVRTMVTNGEAVVLGPSDNMLSKSEVLQHVIGRGRAGGAGGRHGHYLPLYGAGTVPLVTGINPTCECGQSHHSTYKRTWVYREGLGPDPYVTRENLRVELENALARERITNSRELLERALNALRDPPSS